MKREIAREDFFSDGKIDVLEIEDALSEVRRARRHAGEIDFCGTRGGIGAKKRFGALDARFLFRGSCLCSATKPRGLAPQQIQSIRFGAFFLSEPDDFLLEIIFIRSAFFGAVFDELAAIELDDAIANRVEDPPIVRDHQHRAAEIVHEKIFEPLDRFDVEMVRGFVENRERGLRDENSRERDAATFSAAHRRDGSIELAHAELLENFFRDVIARPSAELFDALGQRRLFRDETVLRFAFVDALGNFAMTRRRRLPRSESFTRNVTRRLRAVERGLLLEVCDRRVTPPIDRSFVRDFYAREHAKQGRFSGAVHAEQTDALAANDRDRHVGKKRLRSERFRNVTRAENRHAQTMSRNSRSGFSRYAMMSYANAAPT